MLTGTRAEQLHLRCFIEGEEVPVISANVTQPLAGSASAQVQLLGTPDVMHLKPRSIIEVYYRQNGPERRLSDVNNLPYTTYNKVEDGKGQLETIDDLIAIGDLAGFGTAEEQLAAIGKTSAISNELSNVSKLDDAGKSQKLYRPVSQYELERDLQYDLLFAGEIVGFSYYQDTQTRVVNLLCLDFVAHIDYLNQFTFDLNHALEAGANKRLMIVSGFGSTKPQGYEGMDGDPTGMIIVSDGSNPNGTTRIFDDSAPIGDDIFELDSAAGNVQGIEARLAFMLGNMGLKAGYKYIFSQIAERYVFYKDVDDELNLRDMVFIAHDTKVSQYYRNKFIVEQIFVGQNRSGTMNSVRNLMKIVFRNMHFEFVPISSAPFYLSSPQALLKGDLLTEKLLKENGEPEEYSIAGKYLGSVHARDTSLKQSLLKPELPFAEPPACNIIFPDELYALNTSRHFLAEPTRGIEYTDWAYASSDAVGVAGLDMLTAQLTIVPSVITNAAGAVTSYAPPEIFDLINAMKDSRSLNQLNKFLLPEEVYKGILPLVSQTSHLLRTSVLAAVKSRVDVIEASDKETTPLFASDEDRKSILDTVQREFFVKEANYKWLSARYEGRTAEVSCTFLPRLQVGFTAFIAEKDNRLERLNNTSMFGYFGHIQNISHSVSQAGGVTSVMLTHVRPTNDSLDFIDATGLAIGSPLDGSALQLIPDLREMGTVPWAVAEYGPSIIADKYSQWLGGLGWNGELTYSSFSTVPEYLGVLPISDAVRQTTFEKLAADDLEAAKKSAFKDFTAGVQTVLLRIKAILAAYGEQHQNRDNRITRVINDQFRTLCNRPVANRLQMRSFLNAYYSAEVLAGDELATATGQSLWRARQSVLRALGYYNGETNGIVTSATRRAIILYKDYLKRRGAEDMKLNSDWGPEMDELLIGPQNITTEATKTRVRAAQQVLVNSLHRDLMSHRKARRTTRLRRVIEYKNSLETIGGGTRG